MKLSTYILVFIVLVVTTALELVIAGRPSVTRSFLISSIVILTGIKAILIALFFQHLKDEPKSLSVLLIMGLIGALALTLISLLSPERVRFWADLGL